ncbi:MAG: hypothetical protein V4787_04390 [Pseudomonadota bacterium]
MGATHLADRAAQSWQDELATGDVDHYRIVAAALPTPQDNEADWSACLVSISRALESAPEESIAAALAKKLAQACSAYAARAESPSGAASLAAEGGIELAAALAFGLGKQIAACGPALERVLRALGELPADRLAGLGERRRMQLARACACAPNGAPALSLFVDTLAQEIAATLGDAPRLSLPLDHALALAKLFSQTGANTTRQAALECLAAMIRRHAVSHWAGASKESLGALALHLSQAAKTPHMAEARRCLAQLQQTAGEQPASQDGRAWEAWRLWKHDTRLGRADTAGARLAAAVEAQHGALTADVPRPVSLMMAGLAEGDAVTCAKAVGILAGLVAGADLSGWTYIDLCLALQCVGRHAKVPQCAQAFARLLDAVEPMLRAKVKVRDGIDASPSHPVPDRIGHSDVHHLRGLTESIRAFPRAKSDAAVRAIAEWTMFNLSHLRADDVLSVLEPLVGLAHRGKLDKRLVPLLRAIDFGAPPWPLASCARLAEMLTPFAADRACQRLMESWAVHVVGELTQEQPAPCADAHIAQALTAAAAFAQANTALPSLTEAANLLVARIQRQPPGAQQSNARAFWQFLSTLRKSPQLENCGQAVHQLETAAADFSPAVFSEALAIYTREPGPAAAVEFANFIVSQPEQLLGVDAKVLAYAMSALFRGRDARDPACSLAMSVLAQAAPNHALEWDSGSLALAIHALGAYPDVPGSRAAATAMATHIARHAVEAIATRDLVNLGNIVNGLSKFAEAPEAMQAIKTFATWIAGNADTTWGGTLLAKLANGFSKFDPVPECADAIATLATAIAKRETLAKRGKTDHESGPYVQQLATAFARFGRNPACSVAVEQGIRRLARVIQAAEGEIGKWRLVDLYRTVIALAAYFPHVEECRAVVYLLTQQIARRAGGGEHVGKAYRQQLHDALLQFEGGLQPDGVPSYAKPAFDLVMGRVNSFPEQAETASALSAPPTITLMASPVPKGGMRLPKDRKPRKIKALTATGPRHAGMPTSTVTALQPSTPLVKPTQLVYKSASDLVTQLSHMPDGHLANMPMPTLAKCAREVHGAQWDTLALVVLGKEVQARLKTSGVDTQDLPQLFDIFGKCAATPGGKYAALEFAFRSVCEALQARPAQLESVVSQCGARLLADLSAYFRRTSGLEGITAVTAAVQLADLAKAPSAALAQYIGNVREIQATESGTPEALHVDATPSPAEAARDRVAADIGKARADMIKGLPCSWTVRSFHDFVVWKETTRNRPTGSAVLGSYLFLLSPDWKSHRQSLSAEARKKLAGQIEGRGKVKDETLAQAGEALAGRYLDRLAGKGKDKGSGGGRLFRSGVPDADAQENMVAANWFASAVVNLHADPLLHGLMGVAADIVLNSPDWDAMARRLTPQRYQALVTAFASVGNAATDPEIRQACAEAAGRPQVPARESAPLPRSNATERRLQASALAAISAPNRKAALKRQARIAAQLKTPEARGALHRAPTGPRPAPDEPEETGDARQSLPSSLTPKIVRPMVGVIGILAAVISARTDESDTRVMVLRGLLFSFLMWIAFELKVHLQRQPAQPVRPAQPAPQGE